MTTKHQKLALWFIIISVNVVMAFSGTVHFVQCWPLERLWQPKSPGQCWPRITVIRINMFVAAYSGVMDIVLALMPWIVVWNAVISKKEKLSALFATSMGVL